MLISLVSVFEHQPAPEPFRQEVGNGRLHPLELARIHSEATRMYVLGPRVVAEAMAELAAGPRGPSAVLTVLIRYNRLTQTQIALAGGDRSLPRQLMEVPR